MMTSKLLAGVLTLATTLTPRPAAASGTSSVAQALYDDARKLMAAGQFAEACPKLQESNRIDPGGGTILLLARCHAKQGAMASAWTDYQEALRVAIRDNRADRQRIARTEGAALEARLSKLVIVVDGKRIPAGFVVRRDGDDMGPSQWSLAIAVNPGPHEIVATAPGHATWSTIAEVRGEGVVVKVNVPALTPAPSPTSEATLSANATPASPATASSGADADPDRGNVQRIVGISAGVTGVALLAGSAVFALKARSTDDASNAPGNCTGNACSSVAALDLRHHALMQARTATILFGIGAAVVVGGAVLWFASPRQSVQIGLGLGPQEFALHGAW